MLYNRILLVILLRCVSLLPEANLIPTSSPSSQKANLPVEALSIASSVECKEDVKTFCSRHEDSDLDVLSCLQKDEATLNAVSEACQNLLWKSKKILTQKNTFDKNMPPDCQQSFSAIKACHGQEDTAFYVPCLIEHKQNVKQKSCAHYLDRVAVFVFSDYQLFNPFLNACGADIQRFACGRVELQPLSPKQELEHLAIKSQGKTISCLKAYIEKLAPICRRQIFRILELQSSDYHLDRPLYYACREDRERLCHDVEAGDGLVYGCLKEHKYHPLMSKRCSDMITERQYLRTFDFFIDYRLAKACAVDIEKTRCQVAQAGQHPDLTSTKLMLCLEGATKPQFGTANKIIGGYQLQPECGSELEKLRKEMLDDYRLSPDLIYHCHETIERHCSSKKNERGAMLHCLMHSLQSYKNNRPSSQCEAAVHDLLKVADLEENVLLDRVIYQACRSILSTTCSGFHGHGQLFECLSTKLYHPTMPSACRTHLLELSYFVTRDLTLDEQLLRACSEDSARLCNLPTVVWSEHVRPDAHLLTCLYNHRRSIAPGGRNLTDHISNPCQTEVMRLVHLRAASVSLDPRVFQVCLADLVPCNEEADDDDYDDEDEAAPIVKKSQASANRPDPYSAGMQCLQDRLEQLSPACREAVIEVSAEAEEDPNLDRMIVKACHAAQRRLCSDSSRPQELLQCLVEHKNDSRMELACVVAVRHLQIVALKDFNISVGLHRSCLSDIHRFCQSALSEGPAAVVVCLSAQLTAHYLHTNGLNDPTRVRSDVSPLSRACHERIVHELYERSESTALDPTLGQACQKDVRRFCASVEDSDGQVIDCLRQHRHQLSSTCHAKLFTLDEEFAVDNRADYSLLKACRRMITRYCPHEVDRVPSADQHGIIDCLLDAMNRPDASGEATFDAHCREELLERNELRLKDIRLDPELQRACGPDITRFCQLELQAEIRGPYEHNGTVLHCLRRHFAETKQSDQMLSQPCFARVRLVIVWENAMHQLDPNLAAVCKTDLLANCHRHLSHHKPVTLDIDAIHTCLIKSLQKGGLQSDACVDQVIDLIQETRSDLHLDPGLHEACALDVHKICSDLEPGHGKQMACLLNALDRSDAPTLLSASCLNELTKRRDLWKSVSHLKQPPNSLGDLVHQVNASHVRTNLLALVFAVSTILFILGLCCGRVTKRVPLEVKVR